MKNSMYLQILMAILLLATSCKKDDNIVGGSSQKPDLAYNVKASVMLDLINNVRQKGCNCGNDVMPAVPPLQWNDQLAKAAYKHSDDMKSNNFFDHEGSDGSRFTQRINAQGYSYKTAAENIALGQTTEQVVMNSWINSPGHCRNIMNANFIEMGAGRAGNYWTQVFAAPAK